MTRFRVLPWGGKLFLVVSWSSCLEWLCTYNLSLKAREKTSKDLCLIHLTVINSSQLDNKNLITQCQVQKDIQGAVITRWAEILFESDEWRWLHSGRYNNYHMWPSLSCIKDQRMKPKKDQVIICTVCYTTTVYCYNLRVYFRKMGGDISIKSEVVLSTV